MGQPGPRSWEEASDTGAELSWGQQWEQGALLHWLPENGPPFSLRTPDWMRASLREERITRYPSPHPHPRRERAFSFSPLKGIVGLSLKCLQKKKNYKKSKKSSVDWCFPSWCLQIAVCCPARTHSVTNEQSRVLATPVPGARRELTALLCPASSSLSINHSALVFLFVWFPPPFFWLDFALFSPGDPDTLTLLPKTSPSGPSPPSSHFSFPLPSWFWSVQRI